MAKLRLGILISIICGISDVLLLYHPDLRNKYEDYSFLFEINPDLNMMGWLLGMIFLPLLFIGYKGVIEIADENSAKALKSNQWMVIFLISLGCVVHSVYHFIPLFHKGNILVNSKEMLSIKLAELFFVSFYLIFCLTILLQSFKRKNTLLFSTRYFNPMGWMIITVIIFLMSPTYGGYLMVSGFNLSIGYYFATVLMRQQKN